MPPCLVLASGSSIRAQMLRAAGVPFDVQPARVDEAALRAGFQAEGLSPRDQADALAEFKAQNIALRRSDLPVLGCDQILALGDQIFSKPQSAAAAADQIVALQGQTHALYSAAVLFEGGRPVWRHVATSRLTMRRLTSAQIENYLVRTWPGVGESVGGYKLEEEGVRLFTKVEGDHFSILGLPLIPLLTYLQDRAILAP